MVPLHPSGVCFVLSHDPPHASFADACESKQQYVVVLPVVHPLQQLPLIHPPPDGGLPDEDDDDEDDELPPLPPPPPASIISGEPPVPEVPFITGLINGLPEEGVPPPSTVTIAITSLMEISNRNITTTVEIKIFFNIGSHHRLKKSFQLN
jgi:hypothetical protein